MPTHHFTASVKPNLFIKRSLMYYLWQSSDNCNGHVNYSLWTSYDNYSNGQYLLTLVDNIDSTLVQLCRCLDSRFADLCTYVWTGTGLWHQFIANWEEAQEIVGLFSQIQIVIQHTKFLWKDILLVFVGGIFNKVCSRVFSVSGTGKYSVEMFY